MLAAASEPGERFPRKVIKGGSHLCAPELLPALPARGAAGRDDRHRHESTSAFAAWCAALSGAAFGWGLFAGSSLILGGVLAHPDDPRRDLLGWIMAFGAGVLISAVAYELVAEAFETAAGSGASPSGSPPGR